MVTAPIARSRRIVFSDLDGTLLGPGGSLFAAADRSVTSKPAEALKALHESGTELVLVSGRSREQTREVARVVGASAYIAETGALIVGRADMRGPETITRNFGSYAGDRTPFEEMARSGAGGFLMENFPGKLEPHTPWSSVHREATMLFRGLLDLESARGALSAAGYDWLEIVDNGVIPRKFPGLDVPQVRAYHLVPRGVGKGTGVATHLRLLSESGEAAADTAAVGDSLSDLEMAPLVGTMWIVANGREAVGSAAATMENVRFTASANGEGFAEAIAEWLAQTVR